MADISKLFDLVVDMQEWHDDNIQPMLDVNKYEMDFAEKFDSYQREFAQEIGAMVTDDDWKWDISTNDMDASDSWDWMWRYISSIPDLVAKDHLIDLDRPKPSTAEEVDIEDISAAFMKAKQYLKEVTAQFSKQNASKSAVRRVPRWKDESSEVDNSTLHEDLLSERLESRRLSMNLYTVYPKNKHVKEIREFARSLEALKASLPAADGAKISQAISSVYAAAEIASLYASAGSPERVDASQGTLDQAAQYIESAGAIIDTVLDSM